MDTSVVVSIIAVASGVIVASLSYHLTKMKEREADWRKYKYEQYKEFTVALSGTVGSDSTDEGQRTYAKACNTLNLIGTKGVLDALRAFRDETGPSNPQKSLVKHDALFSRLIWEIRKDLKIPGTPKPDKLSACLWCSGTTGTPKK
jgi:hypothetical protein